MKEELRWLLQGVSSPVQGTNRIREYLQARILASLQGSGAMIPLAFQGGTALRFLYAIRRYSEDLDFALERPDRGYEFKAYLRAIQSDLKREGYDVEVRANDQRTVQSAFIRFPGLPHELRLSPHPNEVFAIKIEVDTRPPAGAQVETTLVRRHLTLNLQHHAPASLLAGKLHAILQRPFTKGRDLYDLIWYLSDPQWPSPNLELLNNALRQSGWQEGELTDENWRGAALKRVQGVDWDRAAADVSPFLEMPAEIELMTKAVVAGVLKQGK